MPLLQAIDFKKYLKEPYQEILKDSHHRYKSWEYCYRYFYEYHEKMNQEEILDAGALNLAFYLASWGMYRGSSFLLQKDYKIHKGALKIFFQPKYDDLCQYRDDFDISLLFELVQELRDYYEPIRKEATGVSHQSSVSDILISKIILGVLGITPAYDRFFKNGLALYAQRGEKISQTFGEESMRQLMQFYRTYQKEIDGISMKDGNIEYPVMKKIDMFFWNMSFLKNK